MSPRTIADLVHREVALLRTDQPIGEAVAAVRESGLPALPVVDERGRYAGIFGEREFMTALFPGYVDTLGSAAFIPGSMDEVLEKRQTCRLEPVSRWMNKEHIEVPSDVSDIALAETFLHHRVLIAPVCEDGAIAGVVTRKEFFEELADRFLDRG